MAENVQSEATTTLDLIREQHAERLGIPADRVALVRFDLDVLLQLGILVDLDVRGISRFTARASWEELGIPEAAIRRARFTRGVKALVPKDYIAAFRSIEVRARRLLDDLSFDVMGFRPYRYVPYTAYSKWREGHERLVQEWEALKAGLLFHYRFQVVPALEEDFREVAVEAAQALGMKDGEGKEAFVATIVKRARAAMPSFQDIVEGLVLEYSTAVLVSPAAIERDLAERDEIRRARRLIEEQAQLEEARIRAERQRVEAESRERERLLVEMRQAELAHYRQQLEQMASPIAEVFHRLRAQMFEDAQAVLATMERNEGRLIGPAVRKARGMIESFRLLNALDDQKLEGLLTRMEAHLEAPERDAGAVEDALRQIAAVTRESAREVQKLVKPSRWGAIRLEEYAHQREEYGG